MAESPLLKLKQSWNALVQSAGDPEMAAPVRAAIAEAEERWELERELHKQQVIKIRKQRHEYIIALQWLLAEARWFSEAGLSPVGMRRPWL